MGTAAAVGRTAVSAVDPDEARRLLEQELQHQRYDAARPTWWDRASKAFLDWLGSLRADGLDSPAFGHTLLVVAVVVLVAVAVVVVLARGLPHRRARTSGSPGGAVFEDGDTRTSADLVRSAEAAAARGDWTTAVLDGFRALARGLGERDLVPDVPGSTARAIAARAARSFPDLDDTLDGAARVFDDVRYLGRTADRDTATVVLDTARTVARTRPVRPDAPAVPA